MSAALNHHSFSCSSFFIFFMTCWNYLILSMTCLSSPIPWHKLSHSCPLKLMLSFIVIIHYYYFQFAPCNGAIAQGVIANEFSLFFVFVGVVFFVFWSWKWDHENDDTSNIRFLTIQCQIVGQKCVERCCLESLHVFLLF